MPLSMILKKIGLVRQTHYCFPDAITNLIIHKDKCGDNSEIHLLRSE